MEDQPVMARIGFPSTVYDLEPRPEAKTTLLMGGTLPRESELSNQLISDEVPDSEEKRTHDLLTSTTTGLQGVEIDPNDIVIEQYSEKSFVVRGEATRLYQAQLIKLNGTWNGRLRGGGGYIFSNKYLDDVSKWLAQVKLGTIQPDSKDAVQQAKDERKSKRSTAPTVGGIGSNMQLVQWLVPLPKVGQTMQLKVGSSTAQYVVSRLEQSQKGTTVYDIVYFHPDGQPTQQSKLVVCNGAWQVWGYDNEHIVTFM